METDKKEELAAARAADAVDGCDLDFQDAITTDNEIENLIEKEE